MRVTDGLLFHGSGLVPFRELVRHVEGVAGTVPMRWVVEPRFGYASAKTAIVARGTIAVASSRADAVAIRSFDAGEPEIDGSDGLRAIRGRRGSNVDARRVRRSRRAARLPRTGRDPDPARGDARRLAALGRGADVRRALPGRRAPERARAQAPGLRAVRGDRRRRDHLAPGGDRRRSELGLPVLVDPRRGVHDRGVPRAGISDRGEGLLLVVDERVPDHGASAPGPVSPRRRSSRARAHPPAATATRTRDRSAPATPRSTRRSSTSTARCSSAHGSTRTRATRSIATWPPGSRRSPTSSARSG